MKNYNKIFEASNKTLKFNYGEQEIVYDIEYINVSEDGISIDFLIDFKRLKDEINVTVVKRVLVSLLYQEFQHIVRIYMGKNKYVRVTVNSDIEESV
jgi:type II secretory pathway component GspD/PulD (secretin)